MEHKKISIIIFFLKIAFANSLFISIKLWLIYFDSSRDKQYPQFVMEWEKVAKAGFIDVDKEKLISIRYKMKGDYYLLLNVKIYKIILILIK